MQLQNEVLSSVGIFWAGPWPKSAWPDFLLGRADSARPFLGLGQVGPAVSWAGPSRPGHFWADLTRP